MLLIAISLFTSAEMTLAKATKEEMISLSNWRVYMSGFLPKELCHKKSYFQTCYQSSLVSCDVQMKTIVESCLSQVKSSQKYIRHPSSQSDKLAIKVGACVGRKFDRDNLARKVNSVECLRGSPKL